jgi:hypothetical protein
MELDEYHDGKRKNSHPETQESHVFSHVLEKMT